MTIDGTGGKYDAECVFVRAATGATTAFVIVVGGVRGTGFSMSTTDTRHLPMLAGVLRDVANQIEADHRKVSQ